MRLYGKNSVLERIKVAPGTIRKIYLQKKTNLSEIVKHLKENNLKFESVEKKWFNQNYPGIHTQGILAEIDEFEYAAYETIIKKCINKEAFPVFLDSVTDPQNLGAIVRTLACMGKFSIVLPEHNSAQINETVIRVANGGENYVLIARIPNIATAVSRLKEKDIWVIGADVGGQEDIIDAELNFPLAIVMGSEGKGIRPGIKKHLDFELSISMEGSDLSYNVSIATAIFCYEVRKRAGDR